MNTQEISKRIEALTKQLTGNLMQDIDIQEEIHGLKRQLSEQEETLHAKPDDSDFECIGCGS